MFRTGACILLFTMSIMMQYARQFFYLQCKLENISRQPTCDCEKKNDNDVSRNGETVPPQKQHVHNVPDDPFLNLDFTAAEQLFDLSSKSENTKPAFLSFFEHDIFHPPRA